MAEPAGWTVGAEVVLDIGPVAAGGACVARVDGRVVFVRHALPGERVRARITEDRGGSFARADAVEVLVASPDRVEPPCPHAGPGRCGGCDWQHASAPAQRHLKAAVVREQFARLARLDVDDIGFTGVEALPDGLLGWRTRVLYAVDAAGRPGLHRHRSREIEPVATCPLGCAGVGDHPLLAERWDGVTGVEAARGDDGAVAVLTHRPGPGRQARGRRPPDSVRVIAGPDELCRGLAGEALHVSAAGFWQVHPAAATTFAAALVEAVAPRAGETVVDLYAGAGALTTALADAVGPAGRVLGLEADPRAVADAAANLAARPQAEVRRMRVTADVLTGLDRPVDLVTLDPPRAGIGADGMRAALALEPRAVGYVSCDPATLARDVAAASGAGWRLVSLRAFDAFPMTHHVECVALLEPAAPR